MSRGSAKQPPSIKGEMAQSKEQRPGGGYSNYRAALTDKENEFVI